jgi:hypothetical protein
MSKFGDEETLDILKIIIGSCFCEDNIDQWREFLVDKEGDFKNGAREYRHTQYETYRDFMSLIEGTLQEKCADYEMQLDDFFDLCHIHEDLPAVNVFCTVLTISASPEMFFEIMGNLEKREYMFGIIKSWRSYFSGGKK